MRLSKSINSWWITFFAEIAILVWRETDVVIDVDERLEVDSVVDWRKRLVIVFETEWYELVEDGLINDEKNDSNDVENDLFEKRRFENFDFWLRRLKIW